MCNQAGFYEISLKRIKDYLGYDPQKYLTEIQIKAPRYEENELIWIKNFFKHQCQNAKFAIAAMNSLNGYSRETRAKWFEYNANLLWEMRDKLAREHFDIVSALELYGIDTNAIPYLQNRTEQNRTDTVQNEKIVPNGKDPDSEPSPLAPHHRIQFDISKYEFMGILPEDEEGWKRAYPAVDLKLEIEQAAQWIKANPNRRKKNWFRFLTNWFAREQEKGGTRRQSKGRGGLVGAEEWGKEK